MTSNKSTASIGDVHDIGSIMLFIPLGVLLPLVFYKIKWSTSKILIVSSLLTLTIELLQMSGGRCFDVDDIILNIFGGVFGYAFSSSRVMASHVPDITMTKIP